MKSRYDIPFDQFQRYEICRRLIYDFAEESNQKLKILDVGGFFIGANGEPWLPAVKFMPEHEVIVIDTMESDAKHYMQGDGRGLPFDDNSFDFVITNDALEHVPPNDREQFLLEIIRVSKNYIIVNNPYYSAKSALAEKIFDEYLVNALHYQHEMLNEHLNFGLPQIDHIKNTLNNINYKYSIYYSGDIDNWINLMIMRHELISRKVKNDLICYLDSYMNKFHFEDEMNLEEGYRATIVISKSNNDSLLYNNFLSNIKLKKQGKKVEIPFAAILDLYKLKTENDILGKYDLHVHQFNSVTPRMENGIVITQKFKCNAPYFYKLGILVATFKENLYGVVKLSLKEAVSGKTKVEDAVNLSNFIDNEWFYFDFPAIIDSMNKEYILFIEQITKYPGAALYYSNEINYGELKINNQIVQGSLVIKTIVREMTQPEQFHSLQQSYQLLQESNNSLQGINLELQNKASVDSQHIYNLEKLIDLKNEVIHNQKIIGLEYKEIIEQIKNQIKYLSSKELQLEELIKSKDNELIEINYKRDMEIVELYDLINNKDNEIKTILSTFSWRLTKPLRWGTHKRRQLGKLVRAGGKYIKKKGIIKGPFILVYKTFKVFNSEGLIGIKRRISQSSNIKSYKPVISNDFLNINLLFEVNQIEEKLHLNQRTKSVDIIVCIHNALDDVTKCLESIIQYTKPPYKLILVDDGSQEQTAEYLANFTKMQNAILIKNEIAKGYTFAANQGLRASESDFSVLLNSDTIVTSDWIDKMIQCAESSSDIGLVGPLSNTASWQSIPLLELDGDWADNELPSGISINAMGKLVNNNSALVYPRIGFLNGFVMMIKREVINKIGYFDEDTFGTGYGEENDYCLRAKKEGWKLAVADDVYVYHAQSKSYSHDRRKLLAKQADIALIEKHGQEIITNGVLECRFDKAIEGVRARSITMFDRVDIINKGKQKWEGKKVAIILPIMEIGGGANVVIQEAEFMLDMGIDVRIINLEQHRQCFEKSYENDYFNIPVVYAKDEIHVIEIITNYDAVIATAYHTVSWLTECINQRRVYYIQDFEPYFFEKGSVQYQKAWASYNLFPELIRVTKTDWNKQIVKKQIGVDSHIIGPSINLEMFRPRPRQHLDWPNRPLRITAMIRPSTPRRNPKFTMEILKEMSKVHGSNIQIILFGCESTEPSFNELPTNFPWNNAGVLKRKELAWLFNEIDIFVDFSSFQAMGLTAMEAMACGSAVIVPKQGGTRSFLKHKENGIIVDVESKENCIIALNELILNRELRERIQRQAIYDICEFSPENAAYNILDAIFNK